MTSMEQKAEKDLIFIVNYINNHENKQGIISMFMKGPPKDKGFMWCDSKGGEEQYWTLNEARGLKEIGNLALEKGWDSSGYGFMMRKIQHAIKKEQLRRSPPLFDENNIDNPEKLPIAHAVPVYNDDEGKYEGDKRAGIGSPYNIDTTFKPFLINNNIKTSGRVNTKFLEIETEKATAKAYQKTSFGKSMDENNKKALDVAAKEGWEKSAVYMMNQSGGDYSRMRSMFG